MANQLHLAYSSLFGGVGQIAAGPWGCSRGDMATALGPCVKGGSLSAAESTSMAGDLAGAGAIDPITNLADDRVWLFHGAADVHVAQEIVTAAADFYSRIAPEADVALVLDTMAVHGLPTLNQGLPCDQFGTPWINACNYDLAGEVLSFLSDADSVQSAPMPSGTIFTINIDNADQAFLLAEAFVYAPPRCTKIQCGLHVVLHGCSQSSESIGQAFVQQSGFNRWADSLDLLVLYPQVRATAPLPLNPLGCWDWWGYTGTDFLSKNAPQVKAIADTVIALSQ